MNDQAILDFLRQNPHFLAENATQLNLHLANANVQPFAQAKLMAAEQKVAKMAQQLETMLADAEANKATMQRIHNLYTALLAANTVLQVIHAVEHTLATTFSLPHSRLWIIAKPHNSARIPQAAIPTSAAAIEAIRHTSTPILCHHLPAALRPLLPPSEQIMESFLQLPILINGHTGAFLLAADTSPTRFHPDLPTDLLTTIGQAISIALNRIMGYR